MFSSLVAARECAHCKEIFFEGPALVRAELHAASVLATLGIASGEVFRFMRKAFGYPAARLAELLDVAPETISRWENGKVAVDRAALVTLGSLVTDAFEERTTTLDRLRALRDPKPHEHHIRLDDRAA